MKDIKNLTYCIVGLGIMGGSFAKAIRENILCLPDATGKIYAFDKNKSTLELAKKESVIDEYYTEDNQIEMLKKSDIIFICLYPHLTLDFYKKYATVFNENAIVTDISGVKTFISDSINNCLDTKADFILGHPMAGGEKEGYINSNASFFNKRNYIIMPQKNNKTENINQLKKIISSLGFTRIVETTCKIHDSKIAFTSQLCHVLAAALVKTTNDEKITEFGGGSFEDLTRIAMINAPLWTELFIENKKELLEHIEQFEIQLKNIKEKIANNEKENLINYLQDVRERRIKMGTTVTKNNLV